MEKDVSDFLLRLISSLRDWLFAIAENPVWALFLGTVLSFIVWGFQIRLAARLQFKRELREACASFLNLNAKLSMACIKNEDTDEAYLDAFQNSCAAADVLTVLSMAPLGDKAQNFRKIAERLRWASQKGTKEQQELVRAEWNSSHLELIAEMKKIMESAKLLK